MSSEINESQGCCGGGGEQPVATEPCCGGGEQTAAPEPGSGTPEQIMKDFPWISGFVDVGAFHVPVVFTELSHADRMGTWKARWSINRMKYSISPGLYAVGNPTHESPVFVSANYKLSFDMLRSQLNGRDSWILVLDTAGINVWCAAGKGTFGTDEIVNRVEAVGLGNIVSHRKLVLPQLGAPGVSAHVVKDRSGFRVIYGPVLASDLPAFLDSGMKATSEMRRVTFPIKDRVVLIPVELVGGLKYSLLITLAVILLSGLNPSGISFGRIASEGFINGALIFGAFLAAVVLTPVLLPWLPGKSFSVKGFWVGAIYLLPIVFFMRYNGIVVGGNIAIAGWLMLVTGITSFLGMNFTGASTYTSLSGVMKEMRIAIPVQIFLAAAGSILWIVSRFL